LQEGHRFAQQDRLDVAYDIFWLTLDEIDKGNSEPTFDLRRVCEGKKSFYHKIEQVQSYPHLVDSRGRIGQVNHPLAYANRFTGLGVSPGYATGHVKLLSHPLEKPVVKEDVLVAYTTDIGWTPLFANAKAVILEVGDTLGHGAVVAREFGIPCVTGIQGITSTLQDGQLVEVDGTSGVIRLLSEQ
jgi:pyruvate,water dikinase